MFTDPGVDWCAVEQIHMSLFCYGVKQDTTVFQINWALSSSSLLP